MKAPLPPLIAAVLALALSLGGVFVWFEKQAARLIATAVVSRAEAEEASRPEKPWDFWTPEMEHVAQELSDQRTLLAVRETELASREKAVAAEREQLDSARKEIERLRVEIDNSLVRVAAEEQRNLKTLAGTYSRLSPAATLAIFRQMDDQLVAKLLSLMKPETTSALLEELSRDPGPGEINLKRAAELTERLRLLVPAPASTPEN